MKKLEHILLVEDEVDIQTITKMTLELVGGYRVSICNNGQELLDNIDSIKPDFIILDVMMPIVDGPTAFKKLKMNPEYNNIPIVFMTAKTQVEEVNELMNLGVVDVLSKPFDPLELLTQINGIWESLVE